MYTLSDFKGKYADNTDTEFYMGWYHSPPNTCHTLTIKRLVPVVPQQNFCDRLGLS